jgi:arylsulfatase A-like enzyme
LAATNWLLPATPAKAETAVSGQPNILIFMPDQHQGQAVLPDHPAIMPNVRRFASQGVTFTRAFCPAPHCCPSRASFMTGLYPSEHGVFNNVSTDTAIHIDPNPGVKFFSETLHDAGYQLAYSGKWHVARNIMPEDRGWTNLTPNIETPSLQLIPPDYYLRDSAWDAARAQLHEQGSRGRGEVLRPGWGNTKLYGSYPPKGPRGYEGLQDYEWVRIGAEGIKTLTGGGKPWCLMVSNLGGHDLYDAPQNFVDMYRPESIELPPSFRDTLQDKPRIYQRMRYQYWSQLSDNEVRQSIAHYWAKLTMQDALFGLLLEALEKSGEAENTIVIYTSDHGDYAGAHGLWAKGIPSFREGYNIPCVVRWPRGILRPGSQVDAFVSTTDFAPTILDAAGVRPQAPMSGMSFLSWLRGETPSAWRDAIFAQCNGLELYYTQRIVMTDSYKYVYNGFDFDELYNLKNDPHEMMNLAFPNVPHAQTVVEEGRGLENRGDLPWPLLPPGLDEVRRDLLKRMWKFAQQHKDIIFNPYLTGAMAPYGPAIEI